MDDETTVDSEPLFQFEPTVNLTVEEEVGLYFKRFPKEKQLRHSHGFGWQRFGFYWWQT
jgi:hypothetical protein